MYRIYIHILFIIQTSYKYIIFSIKFIYDSTLRMIMNFKNIHMMAISATLMVSSAVGYMLVQEAQANVNANGGNANGGNADGGPGIVGLKMETVMLKPPEEMAVPEVMVLQSIWRNSPLYNRRCSLLKLRNTILFFIYNLISMISGKV